MTLQKTLAITILLIGVIGIALVFATDYTYRQLAFEQQKESVSKLISIKSVDLIDKLTTRQKDLGFRLQSEGQFQKALNTKNKKDIIYWLDQEFNRYYVTIGLVKLEKIIIYDTDFQPLARSGRGIDITNNADLPCEQNISHVRSLPKIQRTKPSTQLCTYNNQALLSTVVSVGSLKPKGFIHIITSPAHVLTQIESELGIALAIYDKNNKRPDFGRQN